MVQVINGKSLQNKALSQWTRDLSLLAPRGDIKDRTGSSLAVSYTTYNLYSRGREIINPSQTAQAICEILNLDFSTTFQKISNKSISEVLIKLQITPEDAEKIYSKNLNGIYLTESMNRYYPYGDLLTQVIGFNSIDNQGQSGVESYYNEFLQGSNGYSFTQSDLQGKEIGGSLRYYIESEKGENLTLTIDSKIQTALEKSLNKAFEEQQAKNVSGLVMNPKNGEILAMSSKPSFNLNDIPRDNIPLLFEQSKIKSITDVYEPGSTFKILTLAACLEEGLVDEDDRFFCGGSCVVDGQKIKCWKSTGHGSQTLTEGFANSCNCVFVNLALRLGVEKFYEYLNLFGFGKKTGVALSGESSGIVMKEKDVKTVDLARIGFGHTIAVTPIQLLTAISSVSNGGTLITPSIVLNEESNVKNTTISQQTSQKVNELLSKVTNKIAPYSFVEGYDVGGKTGTAQKYKPTGGVDPGKYISSFVGSYPASDPEYLVLIMVDEPGTGAYYGSLVAAPYGKLFFNELFNYLNEEKQCEDTLLKDVLMPDLINLPVAQALEILILLNLNYEIYGDGSTVFEQLPPPNTKLKEGDCVILSC